MDGSSDPRPRLLTPAEAAAIFRVAPRTLARWSAAGRLTAVRTPGGHRRYLKDEVIDLVAREEVIDLVAAERKVEERASGVPSRSTRNPAPGEGPDRSRR